mgnify:FL=1
MKKRIPYLLLPLITLILEILPYGAVCNFATETRRIRELYSYFDLTPYGYANFAPFSPPCSPALFLVLLTAWCFTGKRQIMTAAKVLLAVGAVLSLCPLLLGIDCFSVVGALISLSLLAEFLWVYFKFKTPKNESDR